MCTVTSPALARSASSLPTSKLVPITEMPTGPPRVPVSRSVRPGWPSLKMITPLAPAVSAFWAFAPKVQVPRWTSAIAPAGKPAKSDASQPLLLVDGSGPGGSTRSTGTTLPVMSPLPEKSIVAKSV